MTGYPPPGPGGPGPGGSGSRGPGFGAGPGSGPGFGGAPGPGPGPGPAGQRPGPPVPPPPPPPGGYPAPPPYQPSAPQQQGPRVASPPRSRSGANGPVALLIALVVIVGGILATVLLVTSDANKKVPIAGAPPTGSHTLPSGSRSLPSGASRLPSGATGVPSGASGVPSVPTSAGLPSVPPGAGTSTGFTSPDALGNSYFSDLAAHLYYTPRALWCVAASFPLTVADVNAVTSAVSDGALDSSAPVTSVPGAVSLNDGRSGTVTISVQRQGDGTYCITGQTSDL